ncbi:MULTISPECIES: RNA polymerase sigma factor [Larkinella]|jgi:RNA polymerase sigma factor (sigma-70 family)|uniref:Sigma-70 family RNA polymerase sigma factor n=3 Tax=Larkinella TaxID=332157 RepID=A0A5N1J8G4_9BACT|nr:MULTISPECIES: sigma-70 family RNA polymerase sigma factor [Larkinella]KAA9347765.1 sigma-70 family RNA polymerase sigma factor [Larkinella humicola]MRS64971.1 sigma-70 family RNA polymerase sigma factor [Larkinella terrae]RRB07714.1 sigma-70 family RNA polymerase sigma factor [Larkinella rosea]
MPRYRTPSGIDEEQLWDQFRSGDEVAFARLYKEYVQVLYHYCAHFTADRALIKDCIHDLFVELWKHRQTIGQTTSVRFYLMASIKRKLVRHLNAEMKFSSQDDVENDREWLPGCAPSYESTLISYEEDDHVNSCVAKAIEKLPRRQREAVYLRYYQNLSNEEISSLMQINIQSVYNLIFGALTNLKKYISPEKVVL